MNKGICLLNPNNDTQICNKLGQDVYNQAICLLNSKQVPGYLRKVWSRYEKRLRVVATNVGAARYSLVYKGIIFDVKTDIYGNPYQARLQTMFHEFGHNIDYLAGQEKLKANGYVGFSTLYRDNIFTSTIQKDVKNLIANTGINKNICSQDKIFKEVAENIRKIKCGGISDMVEAATNAKICMGCGHGIKYWQNEGNISLEGFANMYSARVANYQEWKNFKQYFPKSVVIFEEMLKAMF